MVGNVFKRIDMRQMCSFILFHEENPTIENLTYEERLKNGRNAIYKRLERIYKSEDELEIAIADLDDALTTYEEVFMEIGMKSGARIVFQLLQNDCTDFNRTKNK